MPAPQLNGKNQIRERPTYNELLWEQSQETKTEVRETRKELNARMDRIEQRMDKLDDKIDKLDAKLDAKINTPLHSEIKSSSWQLYAVDVFRLVVAFSVVYLLVFK